MRIGRQRQKVRPSYPSLGRQWFGLLLTFATILALDFLVANKIAPKQINNLYVLLVIFVTYWSGLRTGVLATLVVVAYIPVAANIPGSAVYGIQTLERSMLGTGFWLLFFTLIVGVVQNKLRASAIKAFDAQEAADREAQHRQMAEGRLIQSEGLRSVVVDAAMDAIVAIDAQGTVTLWNPSAEKLFGWTANEVLGRHLSDFIVPERLRESHKEGLRRFQDTGEARILGKRLELHGMHKDGREIELEVSIVPHRSPEGDVFVGFLRDLSDQKRMQRELLTAQKLESVGQLAGGIAHDFNNVLSVIVGYSELARTQLPEGDPIRADLDQVLDAARRSSQINNQLLAFARRQITAPRIVSLNEIVEGLRPILDKLIKEDIELSFTLSPELWSVKVDPGQVEQMLTNLVINARDAMPEGGRLMIETRNLTIEPDAELPVPDLQPGDYSTLIVSDTGVGIPREIIDRVFEPFFTTKEDKGTGLGLASAYGIVRQAGGRISVYSEPGHGTMFRVYLPRAIGAAERVVHKAAPQAVQGGRETVLVAEDNDAVRAVTTKTLQHFGYTVLAAANGDDAAKLAADHSFDIDLLVTDLVMPKGGGRDLAKRLREKMPHLRVLFLSGYTEEAVTQEGVAGVEGAFLQKPVLPTDLAAKVRELLDAPTPRPADRP